MLSWEATSSLAMHAESLQVPSEHSIQACLGGCARNRQVQGVPAVDGPNPGDGCLSLQVSHPDPEAYARATAAVQSSTTDSGQYFHWVDRRFILECVPILAWSHILASDLKPVELGRVSSGDRAA